MTDVTTYALDTKRGVRQLLSDRHHIAAARSVSAAASDIIIDLHSAIESAALTDRQAEAVALVYGADASQRMAARIMGITPQAVHILLDGAAKRVRDVYAAWGYGRITKGDGNYRIDSSRD